MAERWNNRKIPAFPHFINKEILSLSLSVFQNKYNIDSIMPSAAVLLPKICLLSLVDVIAKLEVKAMELGQ